MKEKLIVARWTARLTIRKRLEARARQRYLWNATKANRSKLLHRRAQVKEAQRVIARHRPKTHALDPSALQVVAPWLSDHDAAELAKALGPAFVKYGIVTARRAAAAVAQFAHESAGFRTTTEYADGSAYEGRRDLGNVSPGDGRRYKGRGYIQITGRGNYAAVTRAFGVNLLAAPGLLATPKYAALASCWWWQSHGCNALADRGDFVALTRRINGGYNGLTDRQEYHARAKRVASRLVPR